MEIIPSKFSLNLGGGSSRGHKKCPNCGFSNASASVKCKNKKCHHIFAKHKVYDKRTSSACAIELHANSSSKYYSVRIKEKGPEQRSFVKFHAETMCFFCFVENCNHDASTSLNSTCTHVKNTTETRFKSRKYKISNTVFASMNIPDDIRRSVIDNHTFVNDEIVDVLHPLVQRINKNFFVVKCLTSNVFPVGLLHVNMTGLDENPKCSCACAKKKKPSLKICEHIVLLIAAILSDHQLKNEFRNHLQTIEWKSIVDFTMLNEIDGDTYMAHDNIGQTSPVFSYAETSMDANQTNIDIAMTNQFLIDMNSFEKNTTDNIEACGLGSSTIEDLDITVINENSYGTDNIHLINVPNFDNNPTVPVESDNVFSTPIISMNDTFDTNLELSDCQIELMDQFNMLTDQLDFELNEMYLLNENHTVPVIEENVVIEERVIDQTPVAATTVEDNSITNQDNTDESATIAERQFGNKKTSRNNFLLDNQFSLKSIIRVLASNGILMKKLQAINATNSPVVYTEPECCTQNFLEWLDSVIERINLTMDYNETGRPEPLVLSVSHDFFQCLQARFSASGEKRRAPNETEIIANGQHKGLTRQIWRFFSFQVVRRIFGTKNMQVDQEIQFTPCLVGSSFTRVIEVDPNDNIDSADLDYVRIQPKKYKTFLKVGSPNNYKNKTDSAFIIEWIESVLPKSKYGQMRLTFQFGHKQNNKIVAAPCLKTQQLPTSTTTTKEFKEIKIQV